MFMMKGGSGSTQQQQHASSSSSAKNNNGGSYNLVQIIRHLILELPLIVLFALLTTTYTIKYVHDNYYVQLFSRAERTNRQLWDELTYYERPCDEYDIPTTNNIADMLMPPLVVEDEGDDNTAHALEASASRSVHTLMHHGGIVIPKILTGDTLTNLRAYIAQRNIDVSDDEAFPVSQGTNRVSYGIDATEHPAVTAAIMQISRHPQLQATLQAVLGDIDPASTEITAITSYAGSPDQVWHMDTKIDGNGVKFARTYSHSYSLFIPLQNSTAEMGITEVCPGSHYCANDLEQICDRTKLGLHLVNPSTGQFHGGDAALLNQHVWHRGPAHRDPDALERIVFIMSFVARPNKPQAEYRGDVRQLSRGTYFHQKWNMWGHTLSDLQNAASRMRKPFSIMRCFSLWKFSTAHWGYDLITATYMRFANSQLEFGELQQRLVHRLDELHWPTFLRGKLLNEQRYPQKLVWETWLQSTIDVTYDFLVKANIVAHVAYLGLIVLISMILTIVSVMMKKSGEKDADVNKATQKKTAVTSDDVKPPLLRRSLKSLVRPMIQLCIVHTFVAFAGLYFIHHVRTSRWGQQVASGQMLMRPFPPQTMPTVVSSSSCGRKQQQRKGGSSTPTTAIPSYEDDQLIIRGPTTLPSRDDVLLATRYDAKFLGAYDYWIDYHPGNHALRKVCERYGALYRNALTTSARGIDFFTTQIIDQVYEEANLVRDAEADAAGGKGRILQQDYRNGVWRVLDQAETQRAIHDALIENASPTLTKRLRREIHHLIAYARFVFQRETRMSRMTVMLLTQLEQQLLHSSSASKKKTAPAATPPARTPSTLAAVMPNDMKTNRQQTQAATRVTNPYDLDRISRINASPAPSSAPSQPQFGPGDIVRVHFRQHDMWYTGTITREGRAPRKVKAKDGTIRPPEPSKLDSNGTYFVVSFHDGSIEHDVAADRCAAWAPLTEGMTVTTCVPDEDERDDEECFDATILEVRPTGQLTIQYQDNGDVESWVAPNRYFVKGFRELGLEDSYGQYYVEGEEGEGEGDYDYGEDEDEEDYQEDEDAEEDYGGEGDYDDDDDEY